MVESFSIVETAHDSLHHRILLIIPEIDSFEIEPAGTHRLKDNEGKKGSLLVSVGHDPFF